MVAKNEETQQQASRLFVSLALVTAALTLGLIVFGAVVRVTDSGLGCGNHWPLCNGTVLPPLDNVTAWIEWLHRLFAALIGLFGLATLYVAWRAYRKQDKAVLGSTVAAAVLFAVQSALGAIVVIFDLPPTFVTLHLGTAMLLLAALLLAAVISWYPATNRYQSDHISSLIYINAAFSLLIILTGALVRGSGATLACGTEWPLCYGEILPIAQGQTAVIHMIHRFAVASLGITLLLLVWQMLKGRTETLMRRISVLALVLYALQVAVGALFVFSAAGPEWGAAHVGLAASTWGLLVVLSVMEALNTGLIWSHRTEKWKAQSEAI